MMTRYRTYDDWKLASPDDEADAQSDQRVADCDCCGKRRPVFRTWAYSIETWACEECSE
jgi:hypothetical protein